MPYEAREPWIWNVYFGPGLYMYHANSIKELKEIFSSGKAFEINSFFRHDLSGGKYELEITDKYVGHDLTKIRAEHPDSIMSDSAEPTKNGQLVYLVCTPEVDFEAYREKEYERIRQENREYEEREEREKANPELKKEREKRELEEKIAQNKIDFAKARERQKAEWAAMKAAEQAKVA